MGVCPVAALGRLDPAAAPTYRIRTIPTGTYRFPAGFLPVHPAGHNTNPNPLVTGPTIHLRGHHGKVQRIGYPAEHS
jgi:hypothetical protein